jgi:iron complex transport system substrate-binding protein
LVRGFFSKKQILINPVFFIVKMFSRRFLLIFLFLPMLWAADSFAFTGRTSRDLLGREIILPQNPQRVVSLAPNITEIVFALEQESRLKGVTLYSDYPFGARRLPKVGSYVALDLEKIVVLKPDLCIAIKDGNPKRVIDRLESLGIAVYAVDPRNLDSVMDTILAIGDLLNAADKAKRLVQNMHFRIEQVKDRIAMTSHRPKVFFQIGVAPIVSVGSQTYIHELIELAGGRNSTAGSTPYPRFSREEIIVLSPEVIIITSMVRDSVADQVKTQWSQWPQIPAVRNQRIYIADSDLFDRPSLRLVDGLEVLVKLIHPELFE